jgi:polar amino acid transport system permease protein
MNYRWNFAPVFENLDVLWLGAIGTLRLFALCTVLALSLGLVLGLMRYSRARIPHFIATVFVEFFRNTPVLVQILWFYYALPILIKVDISPMMAATLGIALNSAAFSAEIFRGGIQSIESGQWEGGRALGMNGLQTLRRIVLPQAFRRILPPLTNRLIEIFKMTTLASAVAYLELLQQGRLLASLNFNPIETYTAIAVIFFLCLLPLVQLTYAFERRLGRSDQ